MTKARDAALLEFIGTFMTVSGSNIETISDLGDGVALFEALSEMYVLLVLTVKTNSLTPSPLSQQNC